LEVVADRLREEFGARFRTGAVHVRKRERLARASPIENDQVEWAGHHLELRAGVEPSESGLEVVWESEAPLALRSAVEAGFREACSNGSRGKGALDGVRFSVKEWSSSQDVPASLGKRVADHLGPLLLREAGVVVESPAVRVEVLTPEEYLGSILQALQARGVEIQAVDTQRNGATITAISPLEPLLGCATLCRSLSKGLALVSLEPGGWVVESA
jgi:elongation factor G